MNLGRLTSGLAQTKPNHFLGSILSDGLNCQEVVYGLSPSSNYGLWFGLWFNGLDQEISLMSLEVLRD
jgi:hypothetical protein